MNIVRIRQLLLLTSMTLLGHSTANADDLSYEAYLDRKDSPLRCWYASIAYKAGDHLNANQMWNDCLKSDERRAYAYLWLGFAHYNGHGTEQDKRVAVDYWHQAAREEDAAGFHALAKYHYGMALLRGDGVPQNATVAIDWLKRSADAGEIAAREILQSLQNPNSQPPFASNVSKQPKTK